MTVENESLKAEVEAYRQDALATSLGRLDLHNKPLSTTTTNNTNSASGASGVVSSFEERYVKSGNGIYPNRCQFSLPRLHDAANVLCCALGPEETVLATGGADARVRLSLWGSTADQSATAAPAAANARTAHNESPTSSDAFVSCTAPVTAIAFAPSGSNYRSSLARVVASACMDGTVAVTHYSIRHRQQQQPPQNGNASSSTTSFLVSFVRVESHQKVCQHAKYVRSLAWNHSQQSVLASASADGVVYLHKVDKNWAWVPRDDDDNDDVDMGDDDNKSPLRITRVASFHLPGAVESLCFLNEASLLCYARGTPYFTVLNAVSDPGSTTATSDSTAGSTTTTRIHLNSSLHDDHVSFCVLQASAFGWNGGGGCGKHVVAATDAHRNFVLDVPSGKIVRNFYGHSNDGYSHPKASWSRSGQYVLGNTTEDGSVVVWDVASSQIVDRLSSPQHSQPLRDLYVSPLSDALVATSFDKVTRLWFY